jgi:hypothetical protein
MFCCMGARVLFLWIHVKFIVVVCGLSCSHQNAMCRVCVCVSARRFADAPIDVTHVRIAAKRMPQQLEPVLAFLRGHM